MLRPRLPRCVAPVWRCSRALHGAPVRTAPVPVPISKLLESPPADPEDVTVNGFVRSIRQLKSRAFASIGDGSSLEPLQALLTPEQAHRSATPKPPLLCLSPSFNNPSAPPSPSHVICFHALCRRRKAIWLTVAQQLIDRRRCTIEGRMEALAQSEGPEPRTARGGSGRVGRSRPRCM